MSGRHGGDREGGPIRDRRSGGGLVGLDHLLAVALESRGASNLLVRQELAELWSAVVGETLARQSWPLEIKGGRLVVAVPNPTWHTTLRSMERRILEVVRERCPELGIESLRIVLGRRPEPEKPVPERLTPTKEEFDAIELTPMAQRHIEETVAAIEDEELRQRVAAVMVRQQQLWQWRLAHGWRPCPETGELLPPGEGGARERPR